MPTPSELDLDRPIWGAKAIAAAAGIVDEAGEPAVKRAFHMLERKQLPAVKRAGRWVSTIRRLQSIAIE